MILHPSVVKWAIRDACEELERRKQCQLKSLANPKAKASMTRTYNKFIKEQKERYATVKVVKTTRGWELRYAGDKPSEGTGPFDTVDEAVDWFLGGGR